MEKIKEYLKGKLPTSQFTVYDDFTVLQLLWKLIIPTINFLINDVKNMWQLIATKVSYNDMREKYNFKEVEGKEDYQGTWFGISKPTLSEEGMRGQVEKNTNDILINKNNIEELSNKMNEGKTQSVITDSFLEQKNVYPVEKANNVVDTKPNQSVLRLEVIGENATLQGQVNINSFQAESTVGGQPICHILEQLQPFENTDSAICALGNGGFIPQNLLVSNESRTNSRGMNTRVGTTGFTGGGNFTYLGINHNFTLPFKIAESYQASIEPYIQAITRRDVNLSNPVMLTTDTHFNQPSNTSDYYRYQISAFKYILNGCLFGVNLGDIMQETSKEIQKVKIKMLRQALPPNYLCLLGNHDFNNYVVEGDNLDINELDKLYHIGKKGVSYGKVPFTFSFDDVEHGIRYIALNTSDKPQSKYHYRISKLQIEWLYKQLKETPHNYGVVIMSHVPLPTELVYTHKGEIPVANNKVIQHLLELYKNSGSATITTDEGDINVLFKNKGEVICCLYGHNHVDETTNINGINYLGVATSTNANGTNTGLNSIAVDTIRVDRVNKVINLFRFGESKGGTNRIINY